MDSALTTSRKPPWAVFDAVSYRARYAAVFTAHPTFALAPAVYKALADLACGEEAPAVASHRPDFVNPNDSAFAG